MTRPSKNTDQRLIQAALELIPETGFSGLKLRKVAEKAGVNLGMFTYCFKNKEAFCQRVMEAMYERFYARFTLETEKGGSPEEKLRKALIVLSRFIRDNRKILLALARDVYDGHQPTLRFIEDNFPRHIKLLVGLVQENRTAGRIQKDIPVPIAMIFMIANLAAPNIVAAFLERAKLRPAYQALKALWVPLVLNDRAVFRRLDLIFKALNPEPKAAAGSADTHGKGRRKA